MVPMRRRDRSSRCRFAQVNPRSGVARGPALRSRGRGGRRLPGRRGRGRWGAGRCAAGGGPGVGRGGGGVGARSGVDDGVGLRVRVCVAVAVAVAVVDAPGPTAGEVEEVTVTVVGSVVGRGLGEVFPPRTVSPEPPDSGPPLTVSTSVTVARLAAKTTTAAAAAASTVISGRGDRRGARVAGRPALGMTTVGSSSDAGTVGRDDRRPATAGVSRAVVVAPAGVAGGAPAGRTTRSALVMWRRVTSSE